MMPLRLITLIIFIAWNLYWFIQGHKAYKEKPLTKEKSKLFNILGRISIRSLFLVVLLQLLGISILQISQNIVVYQVIGLLIVLIGVGISVSARIVLASNWSNGYEYQIKKGQELIMDGIYSYIRHPIYSGMALMFIGAEMVCGSWLWVSFLCLFIGAYAQGKREEKILLAHFGREYKEYMKHTKMLIPFVI